MRVIAGTYRSRQLHAPRGTATRPTSDRLRETLFNILQPRIEGARFVDLYAGTGAVGIEALSRGAAHVWFSENAAPALTSLRENLKSLKLTRNHTIEDRGTGAILQQLTKLPTPIDIVYIDPPYEAEAEYESTLSFLGSARGRTTPRPQRHSHSRTLQQIQTPRPLRSPRTLPPPKTRRRHPKLLRHPFRTSLTRHQTLCVLCAPPRPPRPSYPANAPPSTTPVRRSTTNSTSLSVIKFHPNPRKKSPSTSVTRTPSQLSRRVSHT